MNSEAAVAHAGMIRSGSVRRLVSASQAHGLEVAAAQPMNIYVEATAARRRAMTTLDRIWGDVDIVAAPTRIHEAPAIDDEIARWPRGYGRLAALAGLPTLSVPIGPGPSGLPLGLTLFGRRGRDRDLLRLGIEFQRITSWHLRMPNFGDIATPARD
jgi:Asp-tRNA(Asn)/Glu-tRNA(Gln) amidotransferase A subunit family amidase